jgi:hypothetical protein
VTAARNSLSAATSYAEELLGAAQALELEALAARLTEFVAHISEATSETSDLQHALRAAAATAEALTTGGRRRPLPLSRPRIIGVTDRLRPKELAIADHLADRGAEVEILPDDQSEEGIKNPDARVRWPGTRAAVVTEFKTLDRPSSRAVKRSIIEGAEQVADLGGGDVVIDARGVEIDDATVRRGYARARGEASTHGKPFPRRIHVIMPGGHHVILGKDEPS